jgi:pyrroline-5-carboxylate reductase
MYSPKLFEILFHERNNTMKQAKKTRNTAALLALLMLGASCIASCGDAQTENQPVVTDAGTAAVTEAVVEEDPYATILDAIPEGKIDAASALSGCGPAFVYLFAEALADGAVECGLARDKANLYAAQTLMGAAKMLMESGKHPGELKDAVCSPGGTTIAGVHALERGAFRASSIEAVTAAYEKTLELKK